MQEDQLKRIDPVLLCTKIYVYLTNQHTHPMILFFLPSSPHTTTTECQGQHHHDLITRALHEAVDT